jgi:hypothetical protein
MLFSGSKKRESSAKVSRVSVRVSRMLLEPNTMVRDSAQRATSEKSVVMRVGLVIIEDGIVRTRFSLFFFLFLKALERKERKKKRARQSDQGVNFNITLPINQIALKRSGLSHRPCPPRSIPRHHLSLPSSLPRSAISPSPPTAGRMDGLFQRAS